MNRSSSTPSLVRRLLVTGVVVMTAASSAAITAVAAGAAPAQAPAQKATGTPVKVGLLTTAGDCDGCTGKDEPPAAQAAVGWLNATNNGLAGHKIELDTCVTSNDPGKATDCANQMIADGVVAVAEGSDGVLGTVAPILQAAGIPLVNHSSTDDNVLKDTKSTFILYDPLAQTVTLPIAVAKAAKAKKISFIVIDVPTATDVYKSAAGIFKKAGIKIDVVPVAIGTADMSNQAQQVLVDNPDGIVSIIGHDAFCIPALNALNAVGFKGAITTISFCVTDAMRKAVPANVIKGVRFASEAPIGSNDKSIRDYKKILKKYGAGDVDPNDLIALTAFQSIAAIGLGTKKLQGEVTPATVTAAMKSMDNEVLPASGGRLFRCNGKASSFSPAVCSVGTVASSLDASGKPTKYTTENNKPIPN
jgi:branched-chain amino acid transport system substrate-binding protein